MIKRIAGVSFGISFFIAALLFGGLQQHVLSESFLKGIFLISGSLGLILNLFSYKKERNSAYRYLLFWLSSVILFSGLTLKLLHQPYSNPTIIIGMLLSGISLILPKDLEVEKDEDMLD